MHLDRSWLDESDSPPLLIHRLEQRVRALCDEKRAVSTRLSAADQIPVELFGKQLEFVDATEREVGYSGAFGSGKSVALCVKLVQRASHPRAREGLARKDNASLEKTTLRTLLEGDGDMPPVLTPGTYTINRKRQEIDLAPSGGGTIQYFGFDANADGEAYRARGHNLTGLAVDEAIELTEKDWVTGRGRVRSSAGTLARQIYWATNPGAPTHYLAKRYGITLGEECVPDAKVVLTCMEDNPHLPEDYVEDHRRLVGTAHKRYFLGLWVGQEGLVYESFTREDNVWRPQHPWGPWARTILAIDDGHTNPFVILLARVDGDGRAWIQREVYETKLLTKDKIDRLNEIKRSIEEDHRLAEKHELRMAQIEQRAYRDIEPPFIEAVLIDPSANQLIEEAVQAGFPAMGANNDRDGGIARVRQALAVAADGIARLRVAPDCENIQKEAALYQMRKPTPSSEKEEPIKKNDHAWDAARYLINYLEETSGSLRAEYY